MDEDTRRAEPGPRKMPWKAVATLAAVCALMFALGQVWLRGEERDCEWECLNFPAVVVMLGLAGIVLVCSLALVVMVGIWLMRRASRTDDEP